LDATHQGTDGPDTLTGTADDDVLVGLGGNDEIRGMGGDDIICAGSGRDLVFGDSLFTAEGHENGTDQLLGGQDADRLFGDAPDDWCDGIPAANDVLRGGPDNDFLMGHGGADRALGGEGNDLMSDVNDLDCERGRSEDTFDGGAGRDGVRADSVMDDGDSSVTIDLAADTLLYGDGTVDAVELIEDAEGSPNDDTLLGDDGPNALFGGYGEDTLSGLGGSDSLAGSFGDDSYDGGEGNDTATFNYDADTGEPPDYTAEGVTVDLRTGVATQSQGPTETLTGIENVRGSIAKDVIFGNDGRNVLWGQSANDVLRGLGGDDLLVGGPDTRLCDACSPPRGDAVSGGAGFDRCLSAEITRSCEAR
jgi:Ca2+-binding RTX toxin-like protein